MLQSTEIEIKGKKFIVPFPTVGQILDIESTKMAIAGGAYDKFVKANTKTANYVLNLIDAIAYFSILIPNFKEIMNFATWETIEYSLGYEMGVAFTQYYKWYNEITQNIEKEVNEARKKLENVTKQP